jgi:DNA-directed RNA polymerase II subunit RPB2
MRALGVISDKEIIETCLLDLEENENYVDLFRPSIYDAGSVFTQQAALEYIKTFTKNKTIPYVMNILMDNVLPHIGELNFRQKALYIGYMVKKLLRVFTKEDKPTDRDSFKYKRVEVSGSLMYDLFKEYYNLQQKNLFKKIDEKYYFNENIYQKDFESLITNNYFEYFKDRIVETGVKKAFKGNWGSQKHTKRLGVVQDLNRLSFNSAISQLRKLNLDVDSNAKILGPRLLHCTQWGIIDPLDTPDGGNVGFHKHLAMSAYITTGCSGYDFIKFFRNFGMKYVEECSNKYLNETSKVFINGAWVGVITKPKEITEKLRLYRRTAIVPLYTSIQWDITYNEIFINTDSGRLCRPLIYLDDGKPNYKRNENIYTKITNKKYTWKQLLQGFLKKEKEIYLNDCIIYKPEELYSEDILKKLKSGASVLEYIDTQESESLLVAMDDTKALTNFTHMEIHPSLILGVMGNQIVFPENNQLPRNLFSCGQSKQAVSLYNSNYHNRIDKMGVILNYGQIMKSKKLLHLKLLILVQHLKKFF